LFDHDYEHRDDNMVLIQANIDDMNPEFSSFVSDRLFEKGANDVYWVPIIMKKGRPGLMLNVLVSADLLEQMEDIIFRETTTLGLRYVRLSCHRLGRRSVKVDTPWGPIAVKLGYHRGELVQVAPEFKECEETARKYGVPIKQVYEEVRKRFIRQD